MKITTVRFDKKYSYGPYLNYDVGADATLDEGETEQEAWSKLEKMCDNYHQTNHLQNNPHLYQETTPTDNTSFTTTHDPSVPFTYTDQQPNISRNQLYLNEIHNCKTIQDLDAWKFLAKSKPELENAYNLKLEELITHTIETDCK